VNRGRHEKSRQFPRSRDGYPSNELGLRPGLLREQCAALGAILRRSRSQGVVTIDDMHQVLPLARRRVLVAALAVVVALILGVRHSGGSGEQPKHVVNAQVEHLQAESAPKLVVHVVGAVRRPGLYRLADRSRIADAVTRAGGPTRKADLSAVNLAAPVADGVQVVVPAKAPPGKDVGEPSPSGQQGPVHLNTASLEELDALPGVGPVTAQKILDYREQHGAFASIDELDAIPGIGPARLEQLREVAAP
jgi:competence protein ComEA